MLTDRLSREDRAWLVRAVAAAFVFLVFSVLSEGGLVTSRPWGDVGHYETFARRVLDGEIPYHDFSMEYPPFSLPVFIAPALVTDEASDYLQLFKALMAACGVVMVLAITWSLRALRADTTHATVALATVALSPLLLGHVALNRYDLWPSVLVSLAVAGYLGGKAATGSAFLSASFTAKIFTIGAIPVAATRLWRTQGRGGLERGVLAFAVVAACVYAVFVVTGPGGLAFSYWIQAKRDLHGESFGGSLLLAGDAVGVYDATIVAGDPGSLDLDGTLPLVVATASTLIAIAAIVWVWLAYLRAAESSRTFVTAMACVGVAFVAFAKVVSPQFLIWLLPLVPLVPGVAGRRATIVLAAAMVLTQLELRGWEGLHVETWAVWLLLARNVLLLVIFALLAVELARHAAVRGDVTAAGSGRG